MQNAADSFRSLVTEISGAPVHSEQDMNCAIFWNECAILLSAEVCSHFSLLAKGASCSIL